MAFNADLNLVIKCYRYYAGWADKIEGKTVPVGKEIIINSIIPKHFFYNSTLKLIIWDNKPFIGTFVKILKKWVDYWQALPVDFLKTILLYLIHLWFSAGDFFAYTRREPVGVCGQIIPVCLVLLLSIQEYIW